MSLKQDILRFLRTEASKGQVEELVDAVNLAYERAFEQSKGLRNLPTPRKLAQDRNFFVQDVLIGQSSWQGSCVSASHNGEQFALLRAGSTLITASVVPWRKKIRPSKGRLKNSRLNAYLEHLQRNPDLFEGQDLLGKLATDSLNLIIAPLSPATKSTLDQSKPQGLMIAVPYANNLDKFHLWCTVQELLLSYEDEADDDESGDSVWPKLRIRMRSEEEKTDSEDDQ